MGGFTWGRRTAWQCLGCSIKQWVCVEPGVEFSRNEKEGSGQRFATETCSSEVRTTSPAFFCAWAITSSSRSESTKRAVQQTKGTTNAIVNSTSSMRRPKLSLVICPLQQIVPGLDLTDPRKPSPWSASGAPTSTRARSNVETAPAALLQGGQQRWCDVGSVIRHRDTRHANSTRENTTTSQAGSVIDQNFSGSGR